MSQRLDGDTYLGGALYGHGAGLTPANHLPLVGRVSDGATAVGVKIGNVNALSTAGAKIIAWYSDNVTTERAHLSKEGYLGIGLPSGTAQQAIHLQSAAARFDFVTSLSAAGCVLVAGAAGTCTNGVHSIKVTAVTPLGETELGTVSGNYTVVANERIDVSNIPVSSDPTVTGRNVYMCKAGGTTWYRVSASPTIPNNITTTYTINIADGTLGTGVYIAGPTAGNTTSGVFYSGSAISYRMDGRGWLTIGDGTDEASSGTTFNRNINWSSINYDDVRNVSMVTPTGAGSAVCAFDNSMRCSGTFAYNHTSSFQDRMVYSASGVDGDHFGFYSQPTFNGAGGCQLRYGVIIKNALGTAPISQQYGIVVESLTRGSVANYAITTNGTTPSWFSGNIGIAIQSGLTPPSQALTLGGGAARGVYMERHATADTAGNALTVTAGGATVGATNKNGGALSLYSGVSTGTGYSNVALYCYAPGGAGVADNAAMVALRTDASLSCLWMFGAGNLTLSGTNNYGSGIGVLAALTTGADNIAWGDHAAASVSSGNQNIFVGTQAGNLVATTHYNVAIGYQSLKNATTQNNTAVGTQTGVSVTSGGGNTDLGAQAGRFSTTGAGNTHVGYYAGRGAGVNYAGADYNTSLGYQAGTNIGANADRNVFLGADSGGNHTTGSNQLYIANSANTTLIYGDFSGNKLGLCWDTSAAAPTLPTYDLSLWCSANRTIGLMREAMADTKGYDLFLRAGGATIGATDKDGGTLHLLPGVSTGHGSAYTLVYGYPNIAAATVDNTPVDVLRATGFGVYVGPVTTNPTAYLHLKAGTATANTGPLKFSTGALLATPEVGTFEFLTPTFYHTAVQRLGLPGTMYAMTTEETVANSNSETKLQDDASAFGTRTIAAGALNLVGKTVRIHAAGVYGSAAGGGPYTLQLRVRLGGAAGTVVLDTGAQTVTNGLTNRGWSLDGVVTVCTVADAGGVWAQGGARMSTTAADAVIWDMENTSATAVDTNNTAQEVYLSAQFNTADAANTITCSIFTIEILN